MNEEHIKRQIQKILDYIDSQWESYSVAALLGDTLEQSIIQSETIDEVTIKLHAVLAGEDF